MKIIVDECIAKSTIKLLEKNNFEIIEVHESLEYAVKDEKIYEYASKHQIPIITHDRRFGRIYLESIDSPTTILVLAVVSPQPKGSNDLLENFLQKNDLSEEKFKNKLVVISPGKVRIKAKFE